MLMILAGDGNETPEVFCQLAGPFTKKIESAGQSHYDLCYARSGLFSHDSSPEPEDDEDVEYLLPKEETKKNMKYLRELDSSDWKNQDHYKVLGLEDLRYKASFKHIKAIYKLKLLWHHPDKRRMDGESIIDVKKDYFCCITRAYEILGDKAKRRSYDSADPTFDDKIPSALKSGKLDGFYEAFNDCFDSNARWSIKKHVPSLGDENTPYEDVVKFYDFWFNFESWREFSYDQEDDKADNRDERRFYEKQNKSNRLKLKKEENVRIRQLVENAYASDPRIIKHRQDEKDKKEAIKKAKVEAKKAKADEEIRIKREKEENERLAKEKEEKEAQLKKEQEKKQKDNLRKALKKQKKLLLALCKDAEYFAKGNKDLIIEHMAELDRFCTILSLEKLKELSAKIEKGNYEEGKLAFLDQIRETNEEQAKEIKNMANGNRSNNNVTPQPRIEGHAWTPEEIQLLTKAVNIYPPGTVDRWEQIASFLNLHKLPSAEFILAKQVLAKTKELQKLELNDKAETNSKAYELLEKSHKKDVINRALKEDSTLSQRFDTPAEQQRGWTGDEQKLLEHALKKFPASTPERWDRIAECIPGRSTKECITRYKKLVELVKAQRAASANAK